MKNCKHYRYHVNLNVKKILLLFSTLVLSSFFLFVITAYADNDTESLQRTEYCVSENNILYDTIVYNPQINTENIEEQITHDVNLLSEYSCSLALYSNEYLELILKNMKDHKMKANILVDLTEDNSQNITLIQNTLKIISQNPNMISSISIGIDEIYNQTLTAKQLEDYIFKVKEKVTGFEIKVSSINDVYFWSDLPQNENKSNIVEMIDFVTFNGFTYWFGLDSSSAITKIIQDYDKIKQNIADKQIVVITGWPHRSTENRINAVASSDEQKKYIDDFTTMAKEKNIKYYIFEAFDQFNKENKTFVDIKIDEGLDLQLTVTVGNIEQANMFLEKIQQEAGNKTNLRDFATITTKNSNAEKFFGLIHSKNPQVDSDIPKISPSNMMNDSSDIKLNEDRKIQDLFLVIVIGILFVICIVVIKLLSSYFEIKDKNSYIFEKYKNHKDIKGDHK